MTMATVLVWGFVFAAWCAVAALAMVNNRQAKARLEESQINLVDVAERAALLAVFMAREPEFEGWPVERVVRVAVMLTRAGFPAERGEV